MNPQERQNILAARELKKNIAALRTLRIGLQEGLQRRQQLDQFYATHPPGSWLTHHYPNYLTTTFHQWQASL